MCQCLRASFGRKSDIPQLAHSRFIFFFFFFFFFTLALSSSSSRGMGRKNPPGHEAHPHTRGQMSATPPAPGLGGRSFNYVHKFRGVESNWKCSSKHHWKLVSTFSSLLVPHSARRISRYLSSCTGTMEGAPSCGSQVVGFSPFLSLQSKSISPCQASLSSFRTRVSYRIRL